MLRASRDGVLLCIVLLSMPFFVSVRLRSCVISEIRTFHVHVNIFHIFIHLAECTCAQLMYARLAVYASQLRPEMLINWRRFLYLSLRPVQGTNAIWDGNRATTVNTIVRQTSTTASHASTTASHASAAASHSCTTTSHATTTASHPSTENPLSYAKAVRFNGRLSPL